VSVVDTNVISELIREEPHPAVLACVAAQGCFGAATEENILNACID